MSILDQFPISGVVAPGFEPVRAAFEKNFAAKGEVGAALHVTRDGEPIIDLWGGAGDAGATRPWTADSLVNVWSSTKGMLALAMHILAERGLLDFEAPVAHYWPEFAQNGKSGVLVRHLLLHTAGLPAPSMKVPDEALYEWDSMVHALEKSDLYWQPGKLCGYHAASFGWLNGELIRRITGMRPGQFLRTQIAEPLGADFFVGLSQPEQARTAETIPPTRLGRFVFQTMLAVGGRAKRMAFTNPPRPFQAVNTRRWREAEILSSNGHASARGLARMYTALALDGAVGSVRLLSAAGSQRAGQEQLLAQDIVTGVMERRSLGYLLPVAGSGDPRPASAFGHPGMGGSIGFADPARRLAFGYVMNQMVIGIDTRYTEVCRVVYDCLK
jgi:CubicO group peptidase (beta-lactamase class C family)